jgi:Ala-tRNA(Pro) deacylase
MTQEKRDCNREFMNPTPPQGVKCGRSQGLSANTHFSRADPTGLFHRGLFFYTRAAVPHESRRMSKTQKELFEFLADLDIEVSTVTHPPLFTVADSQALRGEIPGGHTKNLFLKDKKGNFFLLTVGEEAAVDLKQIHHRIGAASRVSFGSPEALMKVLGVAPGAVTAFGLINDTESVVKFVIDSALMEHETINGHPLTNDATTSIAAADLVRFARATGHEPTILKVSA